MIQQHFSNVKPTTQEESVFLNHFTVYDANFKSALFDQIISVEVNNSQLVLVTDVNANAINQYIKDSKSITKLILESHFKTGELLYKFVYKVIYVGYTFKFETLPADQTSRLKIEYKIFQDLTGENA